MRNFKLVLVSESGFSEEHDEFLLSLLDHGYELFSVVGKDCERWEDAMDDLAVGDGEASRYITTTSHPGESVAEVVEFAKQFVINKESGVEVFHI